MAVIKTIEKGESLTFGFVLPETYNLANLQAVKIYIGSSIYEHKMDGRTVRVELESNQTALITGRNIVHFVIDDAVFGIKKINCGELEVLPTQATHKDESINTGYDVEIVLSINVETVSIGSVLYDTLKGDKGDAGTIEVGTVTTGDAGTDVIVENVGTPSEAVLNFTIPRGNTGDFFSGDYNLIINKQDAKWVDGWLWIDTGSKTYNKKIDVGYMAINTGIGTEQLKPIVHYPAGLTYLVASIPNGFYLKDEDGRLSENTDFEFIDVRYNILNDTVEKYDGLTKLIGGNAAFDDFDVSHSAAMRTIFLQIYEGFTGEVYRAATDILCNNTRIDAHFEPTYARIRNLDIIGIPITNGASTEQSGSNPDILKISSHYNNTFARKDITANETTFLNNVIAVGSCPDMESPITGTSFGYGVEFFEDTSRTAQEYPNFGSYGNSQSASTAIITAKFKIIKDTTGVSWSIVRKAARVTARKTVSGIYAAGFPWDMYRGFGIIDVDGAIQYIKNNYTENVDYLSALADDVERTRGIDQMLPFENISENTPVPKGKMHEVTENNYTDEDKAKVTELSPLFWDEDNNTFSFPIPDGGSIQIGQEPHDYYTNLQGAQIVNGDIVSVVGATGNRTAIALTDAANDAKALACFGMVTVETIGNNNVGRITKSGGKVRGVNTSGYAEGATIYVDPLNPGKWTGVKPAAPLRAIQIGVVSVSHAVEGVVELFIKVYPRFGELADVDGVTTEILDAETVPVKKVDGLIKFLSWSNIKARLKNYFDGLYAAKSTAMYKFLNDNTGYAHTGSTGYTTVKTITIPAGTLNSDSVIWIDIVLSWTNNSNTKTFTIYFNNQAVFTAARGTSSMIHYYFPLRMKSGKIIIPGSINDSSHVSTGVVSNGSGAVEVDFGGILSNVIVDFKLSLSTATDTGKYESINILIEK